MSTPISPWDHHPKVDSPLIHSIKHLSLHSFHNNCCSLSSRISSYSCFHFSKMKRGKWSQVKARKYTQHLSFCFFISCCGENAFNFTRIKTDGRNLRTQSETWSYVSSSPVAHPSFPSQIPSVCFSLLQAAFNRVQPAPAERTPTMSQSNPGKYLQTVRWGPQTVLTDTSVDAEKQTGLIQHVNYRCNKPGVKLFLKAALMFTCCGTLRFTAWPVL